MSNVVSEPTRIEAFARFFKRYMGVSSLVVAALPVPVTLAGLIPTYQSQRGFLSTYTSLFCFLLLAFIFYSRHRLAPLLFPTYFECRREGRLSPVTLFFCKVMSTLPLILIVGALLCVFAYHDVLNDSIDAHFGPMRQAATALQKGEAELKQSEEAMGRLEAENKTEALFGKGTMLKEEIMHRAEVMRRLELNLEKEEKKIALGIEKYGSWDKYMLATTSQDQVPYGVLLLVFYLGTFLLSESAFILMAIREYMQDVIGISERELIGLPEGPESPGKSRAP